MKHGELNGTLCTSDVESANYFDTFPALNSACQADGDTGSFYFR